MSKSFAQWCGQWLERLPQWRRYAPRGFGVTVNLIVKRLLHPRIAIEPAWIGVGRGERIDDERLLVEINGKYLRLYEVPLAHTEYWGVKTPIRLHVLGAPLAAGEHEVDLVCQARVVYMQFAPGVYGMFDASAASTLTVSES